MRRRGFSRGIWVTALLVSAVGVLSVGLHGLWRAARAAETAAATASRDAAHEAARGIARALADRTLLDAVPQASRFALGESQVLVPDGLRWLSEPLDESRAVRGIVRQQLRRARGASGDDREAALAAAKDQATGHPASEGFVAIERAWEAQRADRRAERDAARETLRSVASFLRRADVVSWALLEGVVSGRLGDHVRSQLGRLPATEARRLLDLLRRRRPEASWDGLAAEMASNQQRRRRLQMAAAHASTLAATGIITQIPIEDGLMLWFPTRAGHGEGAVVNLTELKACLVDGGHCRAGTQIVMAPDAPEGAARAGTVLAVAPGPVSTTQSWTTSLPILFGALSLVLALGVFLSVRGLLRATRAARARAEFLTSVTHELKTPLSSIRLIADMLQGGHIPKERRSEYAELLSAETARLSVMVENVLDLGRIESGQRAYDRRPWNIAEVVDQAVSLFAPVAQRAGMDVETSQPLPDATTLIDRDAVIQVLLSVMDNARKYAGGGTFSIYGEQNDDHVALHLRDRGPGIRESEREAVFERFRRGSEQQSGSIPGVGLGLYLARSIIRQHGGDLVCATPDDRGVGACLTMTLPVRDEKQP